MTHRAASACLAAFTWLAPVAAAAGTTYCVGGYGGIPPNVVAACDTPAVRDQHRKWHEHMYVTDRSRQCYLCFDELDTSCEWDFLSTHPDYSEADPYDCARQGPMDGAGKVVAYVIDGRDVTPPPSAPARLEPKLDRVSPGPYSTGDRVTLAGSVRDPGGAIRPVAGGAFRVTLSDGTHVDVPGKRLADGTVEADFVLPATASIQMQFLPSQPALADNEVLSASASDALAVKIEECALRARIVEPAPGEPVISGQATAIRAALLDGVTRAPVGAQPADVALEVHIQLQGSPEAVVRPSPPELLAASWTPPGSATPRTARLSASGRAGARTICPAGEVEVTISDLGLGFDTSGLPATCYAGMPCEGTVRLIRPAPGPARARVDAVLAEPGTAVVLTDTGAELSRGPASADDRYTFRRQYAQLSNASWQLKLVTPKGTVEMPPHAVRVRPPLHLSLAPVLDFGTIEAGADTASHCGRVDFSSSQGAEEHRWTVAAEPGGTAATPVLQFTNQAGRIDERPLFPAVTIDAFDPLARWLDICLDVPRCDGEDSPLDASLRVVPLTPELKDQVGRVALRWKVKPRGWLRCQGWWVMPASGLFLFAVVVLGWIRPARFPPGASIRVAGNERNLRHAASILLRDCPGSSPGFYRDACLGLHGDGTLNRRTRGTAVRLRATHDGVVLDGPGPIEVQDRRTMKWEAVPDLPRGHAPSPSALYRTGGTYFRVEAG